MLGTRHSGVILCALLLAVGSQEQTSKDPKRNEPQTIPGKFIDKTEHLGIHFKHEASPTSRKYLPETMGSGVALLDGAARKIAYGASAAGHSPSPRYTLMAFRLTTAIAFSPKFPFLRRFPLSK